MTQQSNTETPTGKPSARPEAGTPAYNEYMIAKAENREPDYTGIEGAPQVTPPAAEKAGEENLILGKFKNADELVKAYEELQRKLGGAKEEANPNALPKIDPPADEQAPSEDAARDAVQNAGLDYDALTQEFIQKGDLTAETREKLAKAGIPAPMVDAYIAGQQALQEKVGQEIYTAAGGKESLDAMVNWARQNFSREEAEAFNAIMDTGKLGSMKMAIAGLKARYEATVGNEPALLSGDRSSSVQGYASMQELTRDMKSDLYKKGDPAFHALVARKLAASSF